MNQDMASIVDENVPIQKKPKDENFGGTLKLSNVEKSPPPSEMKSFM